MNQYKICERGKFTQLKVDVHIEGDFADRLQILEAIEKRCESNGITAQIAYTQEWAHSKIKKDVTVLDIKNEIMNAKESHYDSRSFYYLALLYRFRELANIHYISEANN